MSSKIIITCLTHPHTQFIEMNLFWSFTFNLNNLFASEIFLLVAFCNMIINFQEPYLQNECNCWLGKKVKTRKCSFNTEDHFLIITTLSYCILLFQAIYNLNSFKTYQVRDTLYIARHHYPYSISNNRSFEQTLTQFHHCDLTLLRWFLFNIRDLLL